MPRSNVLRRAHARAIMLLAGSDCPAQLASEGKDVIEWSIVAIGPEMDVVAGVNQLRSNAHPISSALDTSFHDVSDAKFPGDLAQIASRPGFVLHHGCAADHF